MILKRGTREQWYANNECVGERITAVLGVEEGDLKNLGDTGLRASHWFLKIRDGFKRCTQEWVLSLDNTELHVVLRDEKVHPTFPIDDLEPIVVEG